MHERVFESKRKRQVRSGVWQQALRISCCAVIVLGLQLTANNAVAQNNSKVAVIPKPMSSVTRLSNE